MLANVTLMHQDNFSDLDLSPPFNFDEVNARCRRARSDIIEDCIRWFAFLRSSTV